MGLCAVVIGLCVFAPAAQAQAPETIVVAPRKTTTPVITEADDPAIWLHPSDPSQSLIIGVDKGTYPEGGLFVWNLDGSLHQHLNISHPNNVDVEYGLSLDGKPVDIAVVTMRDHWQIRIFAIDPLSRTLADVTTEKKTDIIKAPYGLALYKRPADGVIFAFVTSEDNQLKNKLLQLRLEDDGRGRAIGTFERVLGQHKDVVEGIVVDDELGYVYAAEEKAGIHKYYADPDMGDARLAFFATDDGISGNREGLALYKCSNGAGYLLVSTPKDRAIKVYRREGEKDNPHEHRLLTTILDANSNYGDGLEATNRPASADFSQGLLVWLHQKSNQFGLYAWEDVAQDFLAMCTDDGNATLMFNPVEDAQAKSSSPTTNYGALSTLRIRAGDPAYRSYLKFAVSGLAGPVLKATLRLYAITDSPVGGSLYRVSNNYLDTNTPWDEDGLSWSNTPAMKGAALSSVEAGALNTWLEIEVTAAIAGNGLFSFCLETSSTYSAVYSSKEGANPPQLVIETGPPSPYPPMIKSFQPAAGLAGTEVKIIGHGFIGATTVAFNGTAATDFTVDSETQITAVVPEGAPQGEGRITVADVIRTAASAGDFTVMAPPRTVTLKPIDDAQVKSTSPESNYGAFEALRLRSGNPASSTDPIYNGYLKFQVTGVIGKVRNAKLRLYVTDDSPDGGSVYSVSTDYAGTSAPWDETGLNWNNAPAISGTPLSAAGPASPSTWVELDVTAAVSGNGVYAFGMSSASSNSVIYSSKEGTNPPELVIMANGGIDNHEVRLDTANKNTTLPERLTLSSNYPNPFNMETIIAYALPEPAKVRLIIYSITGQQVLKLVDDFQPAGYKQARWDGKNQYGKVVSSGVYLIHLEAGQQHLTRRLTLLK
jgi:3-phytase